MMSHEEEGHNDDSKDKETEDDESVLNNQYPQKQSNMMIPELNLEIKRTKQAVKKINFIS